MRELSNTLGNIAAILGILICLVSGGARVAGFYYIFNYEALTLFIGGTGLMVFACLAKVEALLVLRTEDRF
ncbi:MAG: hypothetical protein U5S82_13195 [Gammaproteobacteria bacterium]|nr:hypothetical protein [Gammaproteobacteria bacterium]